ncbi:MAG: hypothetical protein A2Y87_12895 [Bacteroidetes bacterium RBG_13_46_8]|nr:MAG: hypothetical protein A2Y87_12895 [Bacteroidetes bacterium RBG_13_46_8]
MYREDRNIDFVEIESFVQPLESADEAKPAEGTGKTAAEKEENKPLRVKEFIDGSILVRDTMTRQLPFVLFLTVLAVLYIGNRYHAERMVRKITETELEVKNLRAEQITIAAELMNISKPSEVAAIVNEKNLGLKPSEEPPKKLIRKRNP